MKKNKIIRFFAAILVTSIVTAVIGHKYWPRIYDKYFLPEYENYDDRGEAALAYCKKHGLRTDRCVFVDFSKESSERRFMIYNLQDKKIEYSGLVAHGMGKPSTREKAAFSNRPGSRCSSIGKYHIGKCGRSKKVGRNFKLFGRSFFTNGNAEMRGILIHTSRTVNRYENNLKGINIPLGKVSEGCFTVSTRTFERLKDIREDDKKQMLLWAFNGKKG